MFHISNYCYLFLYLDFLLQQFSIVFILYNYFSKKNLKQFRMLSNRNEENKYESFKKILLKERRKFYCLTTKRVS